MRCSNSCAGIQRSKTLSFSVAALLALTVYLPEIEIGKLFHGDELQIAQVKGKGRGAHAASRKGQQKEQENASGEDADDEIGGGGGRHCPAGQSVAPLRGRGGSASSRGAGCL